MNAARSTFYFFLAVASIGLIDDRATAQNLSTELEDLNAMLDGLETPLPTVDRRGAEMLSKYTGPIERGRIYYSLAHIHAQSGMKRPDQVMDYCKNALKFPLSQGRRMRAFVYWGDAILASKEGPSYKRRREAAGIYLKGLREVFKDNLPDRAPDLPTINKLIPDGADSTYLERKKRYEQEVAARDKAEVEREMVMHRDVMIHQVAQLYGGMPERTEFEEAAREMLGDNPSALHFVLDRIPVARPPPHEDRSNEKSLARRPVSWMTMVTAGLLVIIAVLAITRIRNRPTSGASH